MAGNGWLSGRSLAMLAGGASAAFIASRLLPPLVSQGMGSLRSAMGEDPLESLEQDHRRFTQLLTSMEQSQGRGTFYRGQLLARLKRGLSEHAFAEEDIIYPMLQEQLGDRETAERFYAEHGAIKTHLYALERRIGEEAAWLERVRALRAVIEDHVRQEEAQFDRLRQALDEKAMARMNRQVRREKALIL